VSFIAQSSKYADDQIIIKFKQESAPNASQVIANRAFAVAELDKICDELSLSQVKLVGNRKEARTYQLVFKSPIEVPAYINQFQETGLFEYVEPNYIGEGGGKMGLLPNDTHFNRQYSLNNDGSFSLSAAVADADIDMDLAWDVEQGDSNIVVAVLDAGFRMFHPEVSGRLWTNYNDPLDGSDNDNNAYVDDRQGWDFVNDDNDPTDDHGHGTNVAGIIVANGNNSVGYAGVDWNCKLMVCKILDQNNQGFYSAWAEAIYYAVDNGAHVLNMSVGGSSMSFLLRDAVNYAYSNGVTIVACMMNENNNVTFYPAGYQNTIAVGSTDANDQRSDPFFWSSTSGSCYGSHIDLIAPGNYIYGLSHSSSFNYNSYWGGTSQATPHVAGVCALLLAQNPNRTPDDLRSILINSAEDEVGNPLEDVPGFDIYYGHGRLNAYQALTQSNVVMDEQPKPTVSVYPNPAKEAVRITGLEFQKLKLYNSAGELCLERNFVSPVKEYIFIMNNLPKGVYLLSLSSSNNSGGYSQTLVVE
jgi:thermitase